MDTPSHVANRIRSAAIDRFADDNGIARSHLSTDLDALTATDVARATRTLGTEVVFGG